MEQVRLTTFGFKFWESRLTQAELRATDSRPAMRAIAEYLMTITKVRFDKEGPGWAPLSQSWANYKYRNKLDPRILRARGNLFNSVTIPGSKGSVLVIRNHNLEYGSSLPYARTHQFGGRSPRGGVIPARPYIGANASQREIIAGILAEYIAAPLIRDAPPRRPSVGDWVTGHSRKGPVQGFLSDVAAFGGGFMLRNERGQFVGAYRD